jgi:hypothetical protein
MPAVTSQVYHCNAQQLQCHHGQAKPQDLHFYGPKITVTVIFPTDGVAVNFFVGGASLSTVLYIFGPNVRNKF